MTIRELKSKIESNTISDEPLILKYQDNKFICNQYINAICNYRKLSKLYINSIHDIPEDDLLFDSEVSSLYVLDVEKLTEDILPEMKNVVVICKSVPQKLSIDYVDIPKLINWQIEDYVKFRVPGLSKVQVSWLCEIANYDIYRLDKECAKIEIFPKKSQKIVFDDLNRDNAYRDLNSLTIFNFIDAIMKKNMHVIEAILTDLDYIDIEPTGVITLLLRNFRKLIEVTTYSKWNDTLTCSTKEFYYYKNNLTQYYNRDHLCDIYEFLTSLDYELKCGHLDFSKASFVNYIIINIITK